MKTKILFVLVGIFAISFIAASIFFGIQGIWAAEKTDKHIDSYRVIAADYLRESPEILNKYGESPSIKFKSSYSYSGNEKSSFCDLFLSVFAPDVPDTLEAFSEGIKTITLTVFINGDEYEILFEKNDDGELVISSLTEVY